MNTKTIISANIQSVIRKIVIILFFNIVFVMVIFYGIYSYFEHQNSVLSTKSRVEIQLKTLVYIFENAKGQNIEDIESIFTTNDLPKFFNIKSFMIGENKYTIYESKAYPNHIIFVVFKIVHSKIISFSVIAIDEIGKKIILPTTIALDRDIINATLPLLNKFFKDIISEPRDKESVGSPNVLLLSAGGQNAPLMGTGKGTPP